MHWQPVNEEKEGEKEKISHTLLHSHTARALCPDSEKMREKENTGNCPFENIGFYLVIYSVLKKSFLGTKKHLKHSNSRIL